MKSLLILIKPFFDICLLRQTPQDLPASGLLLGLALGAYTLSGALVSNVTLPAGTAVLAALTDTALLAGLTAGALHLQHLQGRLSQTLTALAGTGAILAVLAIPLTGWLSRVQEAGADSSLPRLLLLLLLGWSLAVAGHILRHALSTIFALGLVLAVIFYWISYSILFSLFLGGG